METEGVCYGRDLRLDAISRQFCDDKQLSKQAREESEVPKQFADQESTLTVGKRRVDDGVYKRTKGSMDRLQNATDGFKYLK